MNIRKEVSDSMIEALEATVAIHREVIATVLVDSGLADKKDAERFANMCSIKALQSLFQKKLKELKL